MRQQKIAFGEMRSSGVRDVLICCRDVGCSHHIVLSTDRWGDHVRPSDTEPTFVCAAAARGYSRAPWITGR
ncbi:hypothetical protein [Bradyrhizobium septentrionale]|uniref:Uncharacterized protein n=1 Tax=Bradyrhizobium septentrionale TaxID=1404411 RepID=A0ABZ2NRP4_9BRAD